VVDPLADRPLIQPHPDRLSADHPSHQEILEAHEAALSAGLAMYVDPSSHLSVLTAAYLAERGTCCDKGCRHCPYLV
jgi:hypothetical protein